MSHRISLLLVLSSLALMSLVPGGPIETRDFSHISPLVLSLFNLFLTTLGLGSLMLAYFVRLEYRWAIIGGWLAALSYVVVYLLDLARLFPTSPTPMPGLLELVEIVGVLLAVPTLYYATLVLARAEPDRAGVQHAAGKLPQHWLAISLISAGLAVAIIVFATLAAMGKLPG